MVILQGLHSLHNEPFLFVFSNVWLFKSPMGDSRTARAEKVKRLRVELLSSLTTTKGHFLQTFLIELRSTHRCYS